MRTTNKNCYHASASDFKKIPGSPIAYWIHSSALKAFENAQFLNDLIIARIALATGDNSSFIRNWQEVSLASIGFKISSSQEASKSCKKWFPCNKGGNFRKWYGNNENLLNWENDGEKVKSLTDSETGRVRSHNYNGELGFQESVTWSALSSNKLGVRYSPKGFMFVTPGSSAFKKTDSVNLYGILSLLSSNIAFYFLQTISATMNIEVGNILSIPYLEPSQNISKLVSQTIQISQSDWDSYETSWDFTNLRLIVQAIGTKQPLEESYIQLCTRWRDTTLEMQKLEIKNNKIFIEAYGLQDELTPDVPLEEITLTCNPYYRYGKKCMNQEPSVFLEDPDLEARLLADTMKEFISYAVGCMFGRYSLDKEGLILANQGDTLEDYLKQVPTPTFTPDDDNIIPILGGDWFADDITGRFKQFLKVTFGAEHYDENLAYIENAIGKDIQKYFLKDFYKDHWQRYKKRPIYWLFKSPKGNFSALIYMHRYKPDLVSKLLNDYLRDFKAKLEAHIQQQNHISLSPSASDKDKIKAGKEIEQAKKMLHDLEDYDRNILYPLATQKIEIDLDDGVKVNYAKFGNALEKIPGLEDKEE